MSSSDVGTPAAAAPVRTELHSTPAYSTQEPPREIHRHISLPLTPTTSFTSLLTAAMPQDMPPVGGYEPVQYRRNLPVRGFKPWMYLAGVAGVMTYGFWRVGQGIREQKYGAYRRVRKAWRLTDLVYSELAREKMWSRIYLIPLLQAEEDRDLVRRHLATQKMEKELLGAETSAYNSDRYRIPPNLWVGEDGFADLSQIRAANLRRHTYEYHEVVCSGTIEVTARVTVHIMRQKHQKHVKQSRQLEASREQPLPS